MGGGWFPLPNGEQTDACENITFARYTTRAVIISCIVLSGYIHTCDSPNYCFYDATHTCGNSSRNISHLKYRKCELTLNLYSVTSVFGHKGERDNPYYFFPANQQQTGTKIYSLTQWSLTVNECDWHILAGNEQGINTHCLIREGLVTLMYVFSVSNTQHSIFASDIHGFCNSSVFHVYDTWPRILHRKVWIGVREVLDTCKQRNSPPPVSISQWMTRLW